MREYITFGLQKAGYDVLTCRNGAEGLRQFYKYRFDIVITDIVMPEKDGIDAIIEMRRIFPPVPIVAMSGVDSHDMLLKIANMIHADATVKKTFSLQELMTAVERALAEKDAITILEKSNIR